MKVKNNTKHNCDDCNFIQYMNIMVPIHFHLYTAHNLIFIVYNDYLKDFNNKLKIVE